ncbi:MAG: hypothetical protein AAF430_18570 [Myxococcota bacterium]
MRWAAACAIAVLALACDRNLEPFDPDEPTVEPDLSKIFPEGADRAQQQAPGLPPAPSEGGPSPALPEAVADAGASRGSDGPPIEGSVVLAPEVADDANPRAILFIIARRGGGGPPLAVKRIPRPSFPVSFQLGPEDKMIQQMPFVGPITLTARLDADGNATSREPGDLMGSGVDGPVDTGATGVVIRLDTKLP